MSTPHISIVIPTFNRLDRLQRVLAALERQTCAPGRFEAVVVSDGSTDGTDAYLADARYGFELVVAGQPNGGPAAARNRGVALARAALVLFIDDDVVATPSRVQEHLDTHEHGGEDQVVIGPMINPPDHEMSPWVRWEQAMLYKQYDAMNAGEFEPTYRQFYTGNASVARCRLLEVGGFDTRFRRAEDVELSYRLARAGLRFVFNPTAVGHHYADRSFASWLRNAHDYGVNEVVFGIDEQQDPTLGRVAGEFSQRNPMVRAMAHGCVSVPGLSGVGLPALHGLAGAGRAVHSDRLSRFALSGLFNVSYYMGVADQLGGAPAFRRLMRGDGVGTRAKPNAP